MPLRSRSTAELEGSTIAVFSPHLDDAVLSFGAAIASATGRGASVRVVTVLGNDPGSSTRAGPWDATCGFETEGEAAMARRDEDRRACEILGAEPLWLPFADAEYEGERAGRGPQIRAALTAAIQGADTVVLPGFPLAQPDHAWLTRFVLDEPPDGVRLGLYVEQPYAALRLMGRGRRASTAALTPQQGIRNAVLLGVGAGARVQRPDPVLPELADRGTITWGAVSVARRARAAKSRAARCYSSQIRQFGPLVLERVALYERAWGGEGFAWAS